MQLVRQMLSIHQAETGAVTDHIEKFAELLDQLVRLLVVEPTHSGSSLRLGTGARTFLNLL